MADNSVARSPREQVRETLGMRLECLEPSFSLKSAKMQDGGLRGELAGFKHCGLSNKIALVALSL